MAESKIEFSTEQYVQCGNSLGLLNNEIEERIATHVRSILGIKPDEIVDIQNKIREVSRELSTDVDNKGMTQVPKYMLPLIKTALVSNRNTIARRTEIQAAKTKNPKILKQLHRTHEVIDELLLKLFVGVEPERIPRLTDFVTIQQAERSIDAKLGSSRHERVFDDKFNILLSPGIVNTDLEHFRQRCELRGIPISVAFIDIDDFGRFNTKHTETVVDALILPYFMSELESHMFERGYAYRQGGDEDIIICPNLDAAQTATLLSEFQKTLRNLEFPGVDDKISVSIGVCTANVGCPLTDQELVHMASLAKKHAKDLGKDRVFGFPGPSYELEDGLELAGPERA